MKLKGEEMVNQTPGAIIGTFEGECADANITNLNGLDITREVWENVFNSEDYKKALANNWYIGYLGHPEDPNCMDFEHACIVMTEGHIDDSGKVYGKFNLVDTPVGRIVKSFIDAGVTFGISVRGAGDIISNSVDPDTFIFRGFDLVTFPAFPEAIPTFSEVAASSDVESQKRYKRICASIHDNIDGLNTVDSVNIVQSCFAKQSDTYKELEARKSELEASVDSPDAETEIDEDDLEKVTASKIEGLTNLYIECSKRCKKLEVENNKLRRNAKLQSVKTSRTIKSIKRIMSSQLSQMDRCVAETCGEKTQAINACKDLERENKQLEASNLKYRYKVEAAEAKLAEKERIVSDLELRVQKTVHATEDAEVRTSNLDVANKELRSKLVACQALLSEYQEAYANLYANAIGVHVDSVPITTSTSTEDLKRIIGSAVTQPPVDVSGDAEEVVIDPFDGGLVTI